PRRCGKGSLRAVRPRRVPGHGCPEGSPRSRSHPTHGDRGPQRRPRWGRVPPRRWAIAAGEGTGGEFGTRRRLSRADALEGDESIHYGEGAEPGGRACAGLPRGSVRPDGEPTGRDCGAQRGEAVGRAHGIAADAAVTDSKRE